MDASDIIRKLQSKAIFSNYKAIQAVQQPSCVINNCCGVSTTCALNFPDYQYRYLFYEGQKNCSTCSSGYPGLGISTVVCGCS
jgi:hypothetical protein